MHGRPLHVRSAAGRPVCAAQDAQPCCCVRLRWPGSQVGGFARLPRPGQPVHRAAGHAGAHQPGRALPAAGHGAAGALPERRRWVRLGPDHGGGLRPERPHQLLQAAAVQVLRQPGAPPTSSFKPCCPSPGSARRPWMRALLGAQPCLSDPSSYFEQLLVNFPHQPSAPQDWQRTERSERSHRLD